MNAATLSTRWSACPLDKDAKRHVMVQIEPGPAVGTDSSMGDDSRLLPALHIHVVDLTRGVWSETLSSDGLDKRRQECAPFLDLDHTDLVNELVAAVNSAEAPARSFSWTVRDDASTADLIVKRNLGALSFSWRFSVRPLPYNDAFHLVGNALLMPLLCLAQVYEHRLAHAEDVIKRHEVNIARLLALVPNPASYHAKPVRPYDEAQLPVFVLSNTVFTSRYWHQATVQLGRSSCASTTTMEPSTTLVSTSMTGAGATITTSSTTLHSTTTTTSAGGATQSAATHVPPTAPAPLSRTAPTPPRLSTTPCATRSESPSRAEDVELSFWSTFDRTLRQLPRRPSSTQAPSSRPPSRQVDLELGHSQSSTQAQPPLQPTTSRQAAPTSDACASFSASSTANSFSRALAGTARVTVAPSRPAAPRPLAPTVLSQLAAPSSQLAAPPASNSQLYGAPSHSQTNGTSQFNDASSHSLFALFNIPTSDGPTAPPTRKPAELNLDLPSSPTTAAPPPLPHLPPLGSSASTESRYHVGPEPPSDPATSEPAPPPPPAPAPVKAGLYIPDVAKIGGSSNGSNSSNSSAAPPTAPVGAMRPLPPLHPAPAAGTRSDSAQPPAGTDSRLVPAKSDSEPARKKQKRKALF